MKDFLQRHAVLISGGLGVAFVVVFLLFVLLLAAKEQRNAFARIDTPIEGFGDLPGKSDKISERSEKEIATLLGDNPNVIGGWASKIHYAKTENPVIYFFSKDPVVNLAMANYGKLQASGKGYSSAELNAATPQSEANSQDAKTGLIRCGPLSTTNIGKLAPGIDTKIKGVCRATIPPFDDKVNLAIVILINVDGMDQSDPIVVDIRRTMLQLQIDIYNRDFRGRETWAHP